MKEVLISVETAQLLQDTDCDLSYCTCGGFPECICGDDLKLIPQSLLQKWLREVYNIHVEILYIDQILKFQAEVCIMNTNTVITDTKCGTYEEVLEEGLKQTIKLISNKNDKK